MVGRELASGRGVRLLQEQNHPVILTTVPDKQSCPGSAQFAQAIKITASIMPASDLLAGSREHNYFAWHQFLKHST